MGTFTTAPRTAGISTDSLDCRSTTSIVASIEVALQVQSRTLELPSSQRRLSSRTAIRRTGATDVDRINAEVTV